MNYFSIRLTISSKTKKAIEKGDTQYLAVSGMFHIVYNENIGI